MFKKDVMRQKVEAIWVIPYQKTLYL